MSLFEYIVNIFESFLPPFLSSIWYVMFLTVDISLSIVSFISLIASLFSFDRRNRSSYISRIKRTVGDLFDELKLNNE